MFNTFYQVWGERAIDGGNAGTRTRTLLAQSHVAPKTLAPAWGVVIIHGKDFDALHASLQREAFDAVILCAKAPHTQQFGYGSRLDSQACLLPNRAACDVWALSCVHAARCGMRRCWG